MAKSFVSPWHIPLPDAARKTKGLLNLPSNFALEVRRSRQLLSFSKEDRTRVTCRYQGCTAVTINHHDVTQLEEVTTGKAFEDDSDVIIECRNIHKSFGEKQILRGVSLKIRYGEAVGIIGPSGTGKSTILKIMAGLLAPDKGEVYICGKKRQGLISDEEMSGLRIGLVFQSAALFDSLTVRENVGFVLYEHSDIPHERIAELVTETLEAVGLKGVEDRLPSELSGGMKKRVALARAIISDDSHNATEPEEKDSQLGLRKDLHQGSIPRKKKTFITWELGKQLKFMTINLLAKKHSRSIRSGRLMLRTRDQLLEWCNPDNLEKHIEGPHGRGDFFWNLEQFGRMSKILCKKRTWNRNLERTQGYWKVERV